MKHKVELIIFLLLGLTSLVYVFPFAFVDAAKLESGVTINAPSTTETEKICDDTIDNDNDGKIDAADEDCAAPPASPTAGTCGLQIVSGVPINYGQLTMGQESVEKEVWIKNEGTSQMSAIIKGGDWVSDAAPNPTISGSERTFVSMSTIVLGAERRIPLDDNNGFTLGPIYGGQQIPLYFTFRGFVNGPSGSFHQEVTIDLICADIPTDLKNGLTKGQIELTRGDESLQEAETKDDNNDNNTSAKNPNTPEPIPIPYPNTNNTTKAQITTD